MTGQVYAAASGKGGVGKTTTVVNLGVALRARDHTVALVDADLGMANLATHLDIEHEPTLHDVLADTASLDEALVEEAEGFVVLPGSRDLAGFAAADPSRLGAALETLAERYDYVLVDTGAGLSYEDVLPLGLVDEIVLVTSPDPAAVGDAGKTAELGGMVDGAIRGVVVTYADDAEGRRVAEEIGVELLAAVPRDDAVAESTAAGNPLEAHAPESAATTAYRELAGVLAGADDEPADETTADDEPADDETTAVHPEEGGEPDAEPAPSPEPAAEEETTIADGDDGRATDDAADADDGEPGAVEIEAGDREDEREAGEVAPAGDDAAESEGGSAAGDDEKADEADGSDGLFSRVTGLFR